MASRLRVSAILVLLITWFNAGFGCNVDDVAVYQVKLNMLWNEETFPMNSKAQWSKVFGQTHNKSYALYRVGEVARPLLRDFVQLGSLKQLMDEGNEESKVYDQFLTPAVKAGTGETENVVFADGGHSLVSLVCRMLPSPDWFIGVDSLDLCVDSTWVEQVTLDLEPLDAGAVDGSTSNQDIPWPSDPIETVEKVSERNPDSPSFSFNHRKLRRSAAIAKVKFIKLKEYSTREINDMARKELISKITLKDDYKGLPQRHTSNEDSNKSYENEEIYIKNKMEQLEDLEEEPVGTPMPNKADNNVIVVTRAPMQAEEEFEAHLKNMDDVVLAVATGHKLGLTKHLPRHFKSRLHHAVNRNQDKDCEVSEWSQWSVCSDSCSGSGEMVRMRSIIQEKKRGGRDCPSLVEKMPCGHHCRGDDLGW